MGPDSRRVGWENMDGLWYKFEKNLSYSNKGLMVVFTNEQVSTMVGEICGEALHSNFEDVEYGPDPMNPDNDECSTDKNKDSSPYG